MWDVLSWLFFLVLIAGLVVAAGFLIRGYLTTGSPTGALFGPKPERRLEVVDQTSVDGRRRLVLIRRDDVEHLIMTGGPVDVVIETGIGQKRARPTGEVVEGPGAVYARAPRATFGQAVGEQ
jgi:hypothetical protein